MIRLISAYRMASFQPISFYSLLPFTNFSGFQWQPMTSRLVSHQLHGKFILMASHTVRFSPVIKGRGSILARSISPHHAHGPLSHTAFPLSCSYRLSRCCGTKPPYNTTQRSTKECSLRSLFFIIQLSSISFLIFSFKNPTALLPTHQKCRV